MLYALCSMPYVVLAAVHADAQTIKEFPIPTAYSRPVDLTIDSNGDIWFVEESANKLAWFDTKKETFEEFDIPYKNGGPSSIETRGNIVWAVLSLDNSIISFERSSKAFKRFQIPTENSGPYSIAIDSEGIIWFTERNSNKIGRFDPSNSTFKEYLVPTPNSQPSGITIGKGRHVPADSKQELVWFTEAAGNKIGVLNPKTGDVTEYDILSNFANPSRITIDNNGNVWFTEQSSNKLGMFDTLKKRFNNAVIPTPSSVPLDIAVDKDNIVWFTENKGNKIGRLDIETATFTEYDITIQRSLPMGIAVDKDRTVWFTETDRDANKIGRLIPVSTDGKKEARKEKEVSKTLTKDIVSIIGGIILIAAALIMIHLAGKRK